VKTWTRDAPVRPIKYSGWCLNVSHVSPITMSPCRWRIALFQSRGTRFLFEWGDGCSMGCRFWYAPFNGR